jgi:predicted GIY-YIG superfamily endonuclease
MNGPADPYRPDLDPSQDGRAGWVYLLHLDPAYKQAEHYTGSAHDLAARMAQHGTSEGARLLQVQRQAGGSWHIARTWPGGKYEERAIKDWKQAPRLCPDCAPGTGRGALADVARAAERIRAQHARRYAAPEAQAGTDGDEVLTGYAARGRENAARFLSIWRGASADEIEQAAAAWQTPYSEGQRTSEGDAEQDAFAEVITTVLERLRTSRQPQAVPAAQPQEGTEMSTDTALSAAPQTRPAAEWMKGAQTAHDLIIRQAEAGYSVGRIAGTWEEALSTYDAATATAAERAWHAGAKQTSADMIQTLREMERAEAEQAQAAREATQAEPEHEAEAG